MGISICCLHNSMFVPSNSSIYQDRTRKRSPPPFLLGLTTQALEMNTLTNGPLIRRGSRQWLHSLERPIISQAKEVDGIFYEQVGNDFLLWYFVVRGKFKKNYLFKLFNSKSFKLLAWYCCKSTKLKSVTFYFCFTDYVISGIGCCLPPKYITDEHVYIRYSREDWKIAAVLTWLMFLH